MPTVVVTRAFPGLPLSRVWATIRNIGDYAGFMDHVLEIETVEDDGNRLQTNWTVLFNGNELRWSEIDLIDDAAHTIKFAQTEGDLEMWRGHVAMTEGPRGCEASYTVEFDIGIPALADLLHPLGRRAVEANCRQMLDAIAHNLGLEATL